MLLNFPLEVAVDREVLKKVILDQHEIIKKFSIVPREIRLEKNINYVLTGLRRAGKTVLLYGLVQKLVSEGTDWKQIIYINFEDERLEGFTLKDFDDIVSLQAQWGGKGHFFFDEIQNIDGWEKFARRLSDAKEHVCITGSNAKMLSRDIAERLGGRYIPVEVPVYSFIEYLSASGVPYDTDSCASTKGQAAIRASFDDYLHWGGFPETLDFTNKRQYISAVFQKVLLGDVILRNNIRNEQAVRMVIKKLAESVKDEMSATRLAGIVTATGCRTNTDSVLSYLINLQAAYLCFPIRNHFSSLTEKEGIQKRYFSDTGLLSLFLVDKNPLLLENLAALSLVRLYGHESVHYIKSSKTGLDIDFFIPSSGEVFQVSWVLDSLSSTREIMGLVKARKLIEEASRFIILTYDTENIIHMDDFDIEVIPLWKWMLK